MRKLILAALISAFLLPAVAQTPKTKNNNEAAEAQLYALADFILRQKPSDKDRCNEMVGYYRKMMTSPGMFKSMLAIGVEKAYSDPTLADSQKLQMLQVVQNQRIIELLEALNKRPKP